MLIKQATYSEDLVKLTFVLPSCAGGRRITVAGEFNGWDGESKAFRRERDVLQASVVVPAGRNYAFRYCVDGAASFPDNDADGLVPNDLGGFDSLADLTAAGW